MDNDNVNETLSPMERLSASARLVSVEVHIPSFRRKDKRAAAEYSKARGAKEGRHDIHKVLVNSPHLKAIVSLGNDARTIIRNSCPPYSQGRFLCPNEKILDVYNGVLDVFTEMERHKEAFLKDYPAQMAAAQLELGADYHEHEYPTVEDLRAYKLSWDFHRDPVPIETDFRGELEADALQELQDTYTEKANMRMKRTLETVMEALIDKVGNVSRQLADREVNEDLKRQPRTKCKSFHGTLISNVLNLVDQLDICNVHNDVEISNLQSNLRNLLSSVNTEQLKASDTLRADTKEQVDAILKKLPSLNF